MDRLLRCAMNCSRSYRSWLHSQKACGFLSIASRYLPWNWKWELDFLCSLQVRCQYCNSTKTQFVIPVFVQFFFVKSRGSSQKVIFNLIRGYVEIWRRCTSIPPEHATRSRIIQKFSKNQPSARNSKFSPKRIARMFWNSSMKSFNPMILK